MSAVVLGEEMLRVAATENRSVVNQQSLFAPTLVDQLTWFEDKVTKALN